MKLRFKALGLALSTAAATAAIAACGTSAPALNECGMVTNGGFGSGNQGIVSVVHPGFQVNYGDGDREWYFPCNARNYVTAPKGGDRDNPMAVRTGNGKDGTPGMPVQIWTSVYFTPNQNNAALDAFLPFMMKYGAATNDATDDASISSSAHSSSPGWENMLNENMGPAIDRASLAAAAQFGPELWRTQSDWGKLADDIAAQLNAQLETATGSSIPYFCADSEKPAPGAVLGGSGYTDYTCPQLRVVVGNVTPEDHAVVTLYNEQVVAEQSSAANAARLRQAQQLYGNADAGYFLGLQDLANECPKCVIYVGTPGQVTAAAGK